MSDPNKKIVGQRLASLRQYAGYNQEELAAALTRAGWEITKTGISTYERGRTYPPTQNPAFVEALSGVLGISKPMLHAMLGMYEVDGKVLTPFEFEFLDALRNNDIQKLIKLLARMTNR